MTRNWDPEGFEMNSKWAKVLAAEVIDFISFRGDESVLDVGTGDGKIGSFLAEKVPKGSVLGIDPSKEMIHHAATHYPLPNLRFALGDAAHFQTPEKFDLITSFTALHLVSEPEKALKNFASHLKAGGKIFLKFPTGDGFGNALEKVASSPKWRPYFAQFQTGWFFQTKENYLTWLSNAGFHCNRIEEGVLDECYDSKEEMADAVREWLPHLPHLPAPLRDPFLNELISEHLKEEPADRWGKVHHYEPFLYIEATKTP